MNLAYGGKTPGRILFLICPFEIIEPHHEATKVGHQISFTILESLASSNTWNCTNKTFRLRLHAISLRLIAIIKLPCTFHP